MVSSIIKITNPEDPRVEKFHTLRDAPLRQTRTILVESGVVVSRMFSAGLTPLALLASPEYYEENTNLLSSLDIPELYQADTATLKAFVGYRLHQGVVVLARRPEDTPLADLDDRVLISNGINNAENIGAIVRSCRAFGVDSFVVDRFSCSPLIRRSIRVSMGYVFGLKVHHSEDLKADISELRSLGYTICVVDNIEGARPVSETNFPQKTALIMGNEHEGVDPDIVKEADLTVEIPISPSVDSLNVACTSSVLLYEMQKM